MAAAILRGSSRALAAAVDELYLGIDLSTQGIKVVGVCAADVAHPVASYAVNFERDFPQYGTRAGVLYGAGGVARAPTLMWVAALDKALGGLRDAGFAFSRVAAVSGAAQQHATVYLTKAIRERLRGLDGSVPLAAALEGCFAVPNSPVWMDSSTGEETAALEAAFGGAEEVARLTGSRGHERFSGPQMRRIAAREPDAYGATAHVALASSFMAGLTLGDVAPLDYSDAGGTNLFHLAARTWHRGIVDWMAPALADRLPSLVPAATVLGNISRYFVAKYGFDAACKVVAWTGDNPSSAAGIGLRAAGDAALSLGTSDTLFGVTATAVPGATGHVFVNAVDERSYLVMLCRRNGSLVRERLRAEICGGSWSAFNAALAATPVGNDGALGIYADMPEICPPQAPGVYRFLHGTPRPGPFASPATEVRALVEGQLLAMRVHGERAGIKPTRLFVTGGAAANAAICAVAANVFGVPVLAAPTTDSAAVGAAARAAHALACERAGAPRAFADVVGDALSAAATVVAAPDAAAHATYTAMLGAFSAAESRVPARAL